MSNLAIRIKSEGVKTLAFGAILNTYVAVGNTFKNSVNILVIQNLTDKLLVFSFDGLNDDLPLAANDKFVMDITANKTATGGTLCFAAGTTVYVKQTAAGAPTSGAVYISAFYGAQG